MGLILFIVIISCKDFLIGWNFRNCKHFYEDGDWEKDEEGSDVFCRSVFILILRILYNFRMTHLAIYSWDENLTLNQVVRKWRWGGRLWQVQGCDQFSFSLKHSCQHCFDPRCMSSANVASLGTVAEASLPRSMMQTSGPASHVRCRVKIRPF